MKECEEGSEICGKLTGLSGENLVIRCGDERHLIKASTAVCTEVRQQKMIPSPVKVEIAENKAVKISPLKKCDLS